ncbi:MAG: FAD-binding protein [Deltaproteobacteria bacterium]|nr:FAD-binding protein [Deltaproteobacteria bacterium]
MLDGEQRRFMNGVHPLGDLAPRDVVAREIEKTMERSRLPNVFLDARHLGVEFLRSRFQSVWNNCFAAGYDLSRDLIPVVPAAHYMIGGVRVDLDGRTSLPGLFASGEVTASGLHGANRLASNSLLEGLVFSRRIVRALAEEAPRLLADRVMSVSQRCPTARRVFRRSALQGVMSDWVGMTRSDASLSQACNRLREMGEAVMRTIGCAPGDFECQNLVTVAALVAHAARYRIESRGTHYRRDFPVANDSRWRIHAVWRRDAVTRLVPAGASWECRPLGGTAHRQECSRKTGV